MRAAILIVVLLAACGERSAEAPANNSASSVPANEVAKSAAKPTPAAKPFKIEDETSLYTFQYGWSVEAAAVPQLVQRFTADAEKVKRELIKDASADQAGRKADGYPYHAHDAQRGYETAGQSERLLSLEMIGYGFTGGAHGTGWTGSLLWARRSAREVKIPDLLLAGASWTAAIRQPFCVLLNREREKRREEPVKPDDMFGDCPKYEDVTVLLTDEDKNGRFEHINVIADQYVAGPYAEGPYEISLPITATMIERLKPEYRPSFEPRPGVK